MLANLQTTRKKTPNEFPACATLASFAVLVAAGAFWCSQSPARAQTNVGLTTIYTFSPRVASTNADGVFPRSGLLRGVDGDFYGTTYNGGAFGWGTVFRITSRGDFTTLAHFTGSNGYSTSAPLMQARDGVLYGTTEGGGAKYYGTVFRVTTNGALTSLHSFTGPDGSYPVSALAEREDGVLYGTTRTGGAYNCGTVFKITTSGLFTTLLSFNGTNGAYPSGGLLLLSDDNGNFLGTTERGGIKGAGTIYKLSPSGAIIDSFSFSYTDGFVPKCTLVYGEDGNFYGTTKYGGEGNGTNGYGSVFRFTLAGQLSTIAFFDNQNGSTPDMGLLKTRDGSLYGVSFSTVYKVTSGGALAPLVLFYAVNYQHPYGLFPHGNLAEGLDGSLYGVTEQGGTNTGQGLVYRLDLRPAFRPPAMSNGSFTVTWSAIPGQRYQLQYASALTNWADFGPPMTATGTPLTMSDLIISDPLGFYRVRLLP